MKSKKNKTNSYLKGKSIIAILLAFTFFLSACGEVVPPVFDEQTKGSIKFEFKDTDKDRKDVGGKIKLVIPAKVPLEGITHYVLYWSRTASLRGKGDQIAEIPKASLQGGELHTLPADTAIDSEKKFILLFLKNDKVEITAEVPTNEAYSTLSLKIEDVYEKPKAITGKMAFKDELKDKGQIQGSIKLTPTPTDTKNIDSLVLYWADDASGDSKGELISAVALSAVQGDILYTFSASTPIKKKYAKLFVKNDKGETFSSLAVELKDYFIPAPNVKFAGKLSFEDQDPDKDQIQGTLAIKPAPAKDKLKGIDSLVLYWSDLEKPAEGSKPSIIDIFFLPIPLNADLVSTTGKILALVENAPLNGKNGKYLHLYAKNEGGIGYTGVSIKMEDLIVEKIKEPVKPDLGKLARVWLDVKFENAQFAFNKADMTESYKTELKALLDKNVKEGKNVDHLHMLVAGNADSRGTNAYNMALGEKRALVVKQYLVALGVSEANIKTISYGEEKPLDAAQTEAAWAKNRRSESKVIIPIIKEEKKEEKKDENKPEEKKEEKKDENKP
ncbi:MAG: outer membrane protein OmpA-like peptidoglycan-associated protein [bacterium]|jgi:outer membrane protein OmpA-like peptidoglycan-associated protein